MVVDEKQQISDPHIFCIGDVALKRGNLHRIESVHNAQKTAVRASAGILDQVLPAIQIPSFWSDQYDVALQ